MNDRDDGTAGQASLDFKSLSALLPGIWSRLHEDPDCQHTSVIVPSLSVNQQELSKVLGASFYEERLLFALIRLRHPNARLIYLTSQPVHPDVVDYYLQMLRGVPMRHARERLHLLSVHDASPRPLTEKVLERPRLLARLVRLIGDRDCAYLTCYNSTDLERRLSLALGIPLNGLDPDLLDLGAKSGNRRIFAEAGVHHPAGFEGLYRREDIEDGLLELARRRPGLRAAVIKLDEGFGGEGNAVFRYAQGPVDRPSIQAGLDHLDCTSSTETSASFLAKLADMGGVVEELVAADEVHSPSVQMRIQPDGQPVLVSSHEQILGGATGQSYLGCRFPASDAYRAMILSEAEKVGRVLSDKGVLGRFAIDFLVARSGDGPWVSYAIEINLRMGGTTPPFHALEFLTGGGLDPDTGLFLSPDGQPKFYVATDNLKSSAYRGLLPEDLFEITTRNGVGFNHQRGTGALFFMIGALSQHGKLGLTCIGDSPAEAQDLFDQVRDVLDRETQSGSHGILAPLLDRNLPME